MLAAAKSSRGSPFPLAPRSGSSGHGQAQHGLAKGRRRFSRAGQIVVAQIGYRSRVSFSKACSSQLYVNDFLSHMQANEDPWCELTGADRIPLSMRSYSKWTSHLTDNLSPVLSRSFFNLPHFQPHHESARKLTSQIPGPSTSLVPISCCLPHLSFQRWVRRYKPAWILPSRRIRRTAGNPSRPPAHPNISTNNFANRVITMSATG